MNCKPTPLARRLRRALLLTCATGALLAPASASAATQTFTNTDGIAIPQQGQANPYPSAINVAGVNGPVVDVNASVTGLSHRCQPNVDLLLVGPAGQRSILYSDTGRCDLEQQGIVISATFDDEAADAYPCDQDPNGAFRPTDDACGVDADDFTPTGPAGPYTASLAQFDGTTPNGAWSLFAVDDTAGEAGEIAAWSVTITTPDPATPGVGDAAGADGKGPRCQGREATIVGTKGADRIEGTPERDVILARAGNDIVIGAQGNDLVCAGRGRDRVLGGGGPDVLIGGAGEDTLSGGPGKDKLFGGTPGAPADDATDRCVGGGGKDEKRNCERGG